MSASADDLLEQSLILHGPLAEQSDGFGKLVAGWREAVINMRRHNWMNQSVERKRTVTYGYSLLAGRKTDKHVPERPGRRVLQTRIEPPMRFTIPALTHNPRPVPRSPFVVKKG